VFPGIAVARALRDLLHADILFVGTARGLEAEAVPRAGFAFQPIHVRQVRGGGLRRALVGGIAALLAIGAALRTIRRFRPQVVVGVGGYASVPLVIAARLVRVPTLLLEQNVIPGATNRILGRFAQRVCTSFRETATSFPGARVVCTGNPVREEVLAVAAARAARAPAAATPRRPVLLVVGGSGGAHRLNVAAVEAVARLGARGSGMRIVHQTGTADADETRRRYGEIGADADVRAFFTEMAPLYEEADLVLCRAGATTIAELLIAGLPAILVPYPYAADDHQRRNAEAVQAGGAATLILDRDLAPERLANELAGLLEDADRRQRMGAAARALGRPEASRLVAEQCAMLAGRPLSG
jgi:UDP-N-acetylglucosamine--N-acetylmuramyl-(pentapeptide) pyrophosphoryl-undecaprenol N-acetylglucosamine transferase